MEVIAIKQSDYLPEELVAVVAELADYLKNDISNITARIRCCMQNHCLDRIFLI